MWRGERDKIRCEMRRVLSSLDRRWVQAASREANQRLESLIEHHIPSTIQYVLAWTAFFPGEVDLSEFINSQLARREVFLPKVLPDGGMNFVAIGQDWVNQISDGAFGIPEPDEAFGRTFDVSLAPLAVVVVPGLAFDDAGNRLGRGKGYYDRFFARPHMHEAVKLGVCWDLQIVNKIPTHAHDVAVDWVCTETTWHRATAHGASETESRGD